MFMGEKFGRDSIWESHLATELWSTDIEIEAVLEEQTMLLGDVMKLEVGSTLMLNRTPQSVIDLRCGGIQLVHGRMGRAGNQIAVRVEDSLKKLQGAQ